MRFTYHGEISYGILAQQITAGSSDESRAGAGWHYPPRVPERWASRPTKKVNHMKTRKDQILTTVIIIAGFLLCGGCGHRELTIRANIDGTDVFKVSGNRLWVEHEEASLPGKIIHVNGQPWMPQWNDKVSTPFEGISPRFKVSDPQKIQVSKKLGRGIVAISEMPSLGNNGTLAVRVVDDDPGADWYEIHISW